MLPPSHLKGLPQEALQEPGPDPASASPTPNPSFWRVLTPKMLCAFAWEPGDKEDLMNWESVICSGEVHYMISLRKTKNIPYE